MKYLNSIYSVCERTCDTCKVLYIRFIQGIGAAAASACLAGILMLFYPNNKEFIGGFTETCQNLGYFMGELPSRILGDKTGRHDTIMQLLPMAMKFLTIKNFHMTGPTVGSIIYEWSSFSIPFYSVGAFILLVTFCLMILITPSKSGNTAEEPNAKTLTIWEVTKVLKVNGEEV